jgi:NADH dehydrogenase FAD-containing subunit
MKKRNIVVVGGGFAGFAALRHFAKHRDRWKKRFDLILADPKENFEFLPMLPDVLSGRISPETLRFPLRELCLKSGCAFLNEGVTRIDPREKIFYAGEKATDYEYVLVSSGAKTDFHGNKEMESACFTFNSVDDAVNLRNEIISRISSNRSVNIVIAGAGYTGVELAAASAMFLESSGVSHKVIITENSQEILAASPQWVRRQSRRELEKANVEIILGEKLGSLGSGEVLLSSGRKIDDTVCVWAAGVRPPEFLENIPGEKFRGRIRVDRVLNPEKRSCGSDLFVAGDAAAFFPDSSERPLRMAVMFAISQGITAAENIMRKIKGEDLGVYRAVDLGYVIPLSRGKAPGLVLGKKIPSRIGYLLHYFMCLYRAPFRGKVRILSDIILKRRVAWTGKKG